MTLAGSTAGIFCILRMIPSKNLEDTRAAPTIRNLADDWPEETVTRVKTAGLEDVDSPTLLLLQQQPREQRRRINKIFFDCLLEMKTKIDVCIWIKQHLEAETCNTVLDDHNNNTCFKRVQDKVEDTILQMKAWFESVKTEYCGTPTKFTKIPLLAVSKMVFLVTVSYADLVKDTAFLILLWKILQSTVFTHFLAFTSQIWWILAISILIPLMTSAWENVSRRPMVILGNFVQTPVYKLHKKSSQAKLYPANNY